MVCVDKLEECSEVKRYCDRRAIKIYSRIDCAELGEKIIMRIDLLRSAFAFGEHGTYDAIIASVLIGQLIVAL